MKQFFKMMFASMIGGILSLVVLFFLFFIIIMGIVASTADNDKVDVKENSILRITLSENISERSTDNPFEDFDFMSFENNSSVGLKEIIATIAKAKEDQNIKGIYLDVSFISGGLTTVEEIRNALIDFKKSNKFIFQNKQISQQFKAAGCTSSLPNSSANTLRKR
jgi:protease-4